MDSGMKIGRVKITFLSLTSSPFVGTGFSIVATARAVADMGTTILFTSSLSQAADSSASLKRFCPRSQTGDSGSIDITMASDAANEQQIQPKTFHLAKVPITYATRIPNDIMIDGSEPRIPRIWGSQLSLILRGGERVKMKKEEAMHEGIYIDLRRRQAETDTKSGQEASGDEDLVPLRRRY